MCPSRAKVINSQCAFIISPQREADVLSLQKLLLSEIYLCVYSVCACAPHVFGYPRGPEETPHPLELKLQKLFN